MSEEMSGIGELAATRFVEEKAGAWRESFEHAVAVPFCCRACIWLESHVLICHTGLGDFVFYSILVGRASMHSVSSLVICTMAVLTGLCGTLALLPILERVLPALPISIAIGIGAHPLDLWVLPTRFRRGVSGVDPSV